MRKELATVNWTTEWRRDYIAVSIKDDHLLVLSFKLPTATAVTRSAAQCLV